MRSALPKVLQPLGGRPLLAHVLSTARKLEPREPSASSIPAARCASALPIPT